MADQRFKGGFFIIGNLFDVEVPLPIEISRDLRIERPNSAQIQTVQDFIGRALPMIDLRSLFEMRREAEQDAGGVLPPTSLESEPRYLLLTYSGTNIHPHKFLEAANLTVCNLHWIAFTLTSEPFGQGDIVGWSIDSVATHAHFFRMLELYQSEVLHQDTVDELRATYEKYQEFDREAHPGICRAVQLFNTFKRLPLFDFLDVLAMFMLIEMLLTHNPGDKEIGDSLRHQVCQKVPFVFERMGVEIDYSCFSDANPTTIWSKLYDYRSKVAHGDVPDFGNKLKVLRDSRTANLFLFNIARMMLRHALDDPGLFAGLKPI